MIKVEHIQASICANTGQRIDTLICEYPRAIHAQLLTHRVFSKNSSSTRAIPLHKAIEQIEANPAEYIWTSKQAGMQGAVITDEKLLGEINSEFNSAMGKMIDRANYLVNDLGVHKQNAGRLLEPFQNIKIVLTSTEWENWDWLRDDPAAQGEIAELARAISKARAEAEPMVLNEGEWHVPFVERERKESGGLRYFTSETTEVDDYVTVLTVEEAKLVSMSVCAQTSYRNADYSLEKAIDMRGKLLDSKKVHASPSEHQSYAIDYKGVDSFVPTTWPDGITHVDHDGALWSANFKGFVQHRQLLKGHDKAKS
ncbi:FAD-dependent thymidylate synthase [Crocinitomicaceae bacterium]|nr:FAD-dependent thymidylate synthase [Crocinitomicaceae bacterium]